MYPQYFVSGIEGTYQMGKVFYFAAAPFYKEIPLDFFNELCKIK